MKIVAITQARIGSSRLPRKVLLPLGSSTVLATHLKRVSKSKFISKIVVATTFETESSLIIDIAKDNTCSVFQGSTNDVLDRYYQAAKEVSADIIIRLTSDCPLIDHNYIDNLIEVFKDNKFEYISNCFPATLPDGMDAEIFTFNILEKAWKKSTLKSDREHVTPFIRENFPETCHYLTYQPDYSKIRLTLDTQEDYQVINSLVNNCGWDKPLESYIEYIKKNPDLMNTNSHIKRNEGYQKSLKGD